MSDWSIFEWVAYGLLGLGALGLAFKAAAKFLLGVWNFIPGFGLGYLIRIPKKFGFRNTRSKPSIFGAAGMEGRLALAILSLVALLAFPLLSAIYLSVAAIVSIDWPTLDSVEGLALRYQSQIIFMIVNIAGVSISAFFLTRVVYTFLLWRSLSQGYDSVVNFFQTLAALPIVFLGISMAVALSNAGIDVSSLINQYTVWILLSLGMVPSLVAQLAHEAPATARRSRDLIEQYLGIGDRPLSAYYNGIVSTPRTGRYLLWVSIWTAIRIVAEIGVFRALTADKENLQIDDFIINLMTNFGPENIGAFVLIMALVGLLGILVSTFRS